MDNHVHFIAVPEGKESLAKGIGEANRHYTLYINKREQWRGFLWQGRFLSYAMDDRHLYRAIRYVELNPVKAQIVEKPEDYPWSSARAHLQRQEDPLLERSLSVESIGNWQEYLEGGLREGEAEMFEGHIRNGKPLGNEAFIECLEKETGRSLLLRNPGPRPHPVF